MRRREGLRAGWKSYVLAVLVTAVAVAARWLLDPWVGELLAFGTLSLRILVVDDNQDSAESLALLLRLTGHETQLAYDGLAAIDAAERFQPDVVLLDIGLPKLNGFDACRRIREQPWGKRMLVVALTGWGQDEDRRKSKDAGFDGHLVKPVDHAALMELLTSLAGGGG